MTAKAMKKAMKATMKAAKAMEKKRLQQTLWQVVAEEVSTGRREPVKTVCTIVIGDEVPMSFPADLIPEFAKFVRKWDYHVTSWSVSGPEAKSVARNIDF